LLLERGDLDLGVLVMDEDAMMVEQALRDRGLEILSLPQADVIARRLPQCTYRPNRRRSIRSRPVAAADG
jgi:hypothetical protein